MATLVKFQCLGLDCGKKKHDFSADSFKVLLTSVAPNAATNDEKADLTEISPGNGYSAGGLTIAVSSFTQTGGVAKLVMADSALLTASGGSIAGFRYAVIYNDTTSGKPLVGYVDYGSTLTLAAGQEFQVQPNATTGVLTIT